MGLNVSIITTTFNSARTIGQTMESVAGQDYPFIEHIIVDSHSSDRTLAIVEGFSHTALVLSEKDDGLYYGMNKGILAAKGDVIGILNSDDVYAHEGVISHIVGAFKDDQVEAVYGDLQFTDPEDPDRITRTWKSGHYGARSFYYGWMPPHPTFFVRKSVYDELGLFDTRLRSAADYEMMLRIMLKNQRPAAYIPEVLVKMRSGGASNSSFRNRLKANREDRRAWRLNELQPYFFTLYLKPLRKISQFILR
jgi:glycosyltransferase